MFKQNERKTMLAGKDMDQNASAKALSFIVMTFDLWLK
jgi:hypothetical protein